MPLVTINLGNKAEADAAWAREQLRQHKGIRGIPVHTISIDGMLYFHGHSYTVNDDLAARLTQKAKEYRDANG